MSNINDTEFGDQRAKDMIWITPNLAVGSAYHDSNKNVLDAQGIAASLQLYEGH